MRGQKYYLPYRKLDSMLHQNKTLQLLSLLALFLTFSCSDEKSGSTTTDKEKDADKAAQFASTADKTATDKNAVTDGPAVAMLETDKFVMKLHKAIAFFPKSDPFGMFKVTEGHHFIVLDMSVKNKTSEILDMGQIFIHANVKDDKGNKYNILSGVTPIASYTYDNPTDYHQKEYEALWSNTFPANGFHRTTVLGLEAPKDVKNFILTIPTEPGSKKEKKEIQFTL